MVKTPSTMVELGTESPSFSLLDPVTGRKVCRDDFAGAQGLLVAFLCNHCPFVKHIAGDFAAFAVEYQERGLAIVGINSNDVEPIQRTVLNTWLLRQVSVGTHSRISWMSHRRLLSPIGLLAPLISSYLIMISGLSTEASLIGAGLLLRHQLRVLIFEMLVTLYSLELPLRTYKSLA